MPANLGRDLPASPYRFSISNDRVSLATAWPALDEHTQTSSVCNAFAQVGELSSVAMPGSVAAVA